MALIALGFQLWLSRNVPRASDWRAAAGALAAARQPGDVVFLFPWWLERARALVPGDLPVVGYLHDEGDPLTEHARIWLFAAPDLPRAPTAALRASFLPDRTPSGPTQRFGALALTPYRNGRFRAVRFSAVDALGAADVSLVAADGARTACEHAEGRVRCPGQPPVEAAWHEVNFWPRRCVTVVPPGGATRLELAFHGLPAAATLRLEAGLVWENGYQTGPELTPVYVQLTDAVRGRPLGELTLPVGHEGILGLEVPAAGVRDVAVSLQSDRADRRTTCVVLRALAPAGAP